ncbi:MULTISPECIES: TetR/AcrR family transcriptional regulator [Acinetobacter]|uniref:TetR/AcrR family transcriptional regulator n=1 Tax=Acinetobacter TaxID=469 RepID=UPI00124E5732|nr:MULTISPECIES: TetR/AcrR family transcriptional regulator [Acinetobacter]MBJ9372507.1 TetR/AcrR family transcriptional regulator [Acinetobacter sp. TGL-Y2]MBO3655378.1 TetR/AcrR family transcriptional regulator [Acinetobacter bereziniae]
MQNVGLDIEKQTRSGGRSEKILMAIHQATYELLQLRDYDEIELTEIARRAQVNKTTVYRRWATKAELVLDVILMRIKADLPLPDTGAVLSDLCIFLKMLQHMLQQSFILNIFKVFISNQDAQVSIARQRFWNERFLLAQPLIDRAVQRGELFEGTQVREFFEFACAPIFYRTLIIGELISDQDIEILSLRTISYFSKQ